MRGWTTWMVTVACVCAVPGVALAQKPAFDCAKATGAVEKLICADAGLAAQDTKLDGVYKAAVAKAKGPLLATLRTEQRGWVKGRNDCWKSDNTETWLTATWTVKSVHDCVEGQYKLRTTELQAVWQLVPPKTVSYACQNNPANEVVANYFETDPATIRLERGDQTKTLWLVPPANAGKYEGQNVSLTRKGNDAAVSWMNVKTGETDQLECKPR